jgi:hypothetical protein
MWLARVVVHRQQTKGERIPYPKNFIGIGYYYWYHPDYRYGSLLFQFSLRFRPVII